MKMSRAFTFQPSLRSKINKPKKKSSIVISQILRSQERGYVQRIVPFHIIYAPSAQFKDTSDTVARHLNRDPYELIHLS